MEGLSPERIEKWLKEYMNDDKTDGRFYRLVQKVWDAAKKDWDESR